MSDERVGAAGLEVRRHDAGEGQGEGVGAVGPGGPSEQAERREEEGGAGRHAGGRNRADQDGEPLRQEDQAGALGGAVPVLAGRTGKGAPDPGQERHGQGRQRGGGQEAEVGHGALSRARMRRAYSAFARRAEGENRRKNRARAESHGSSSSAPQRRA